MKNGEAKVEAKTWEIEFADSVLYGEGLLSLKADCRRWPTHRARRSGNS
jgi:hypothetical protein